MLWRLPVAVSGVEMSWLDPASMLAAFRADGLDRVLVIDAPVRGIALFSRGGLVAVYSETQRSAVASPERLRSLLSQARGRLTVMERKPRPVAADATNPVTAHDFFELAPAESAEQPAAAENSVADEQPIADEHPAASLEPETTGAVELLRKTAPTSTRRERHRPHHPTRRLLPRRPRRHPFLRRRSTRQRMRNRTPLGSQSVRAGASAGLGRRAPRSRLPTWPPQWPMSRRPRRNRDLCLLECAAAQ